jgi:hypothetical protein
MTDMLGTIALHVAELDPDTYPLDDTTRTAASAST